MIFIACWYKLKIMPTKVKAKPNAKAKEAKVEYKHGTSKIIDSIAALPQAERVRLHGELQNAVNHDRDLLSQSIASDRGHYDNLITTYEGSL